MSEKTCPQCGRDLTWESTSADYDDELIYEYWKCYYCGFSQDIDRYYELKESDSSAEAS